MCACSRGDFREEGAQDRCESVGLFEMRGVPRSGDECEPRVGTDRPGRAYADVAVRSVVFAADDEDGHGEAMKIVPHRLHCTGPGVAQAFGETPRAVVSDAIVFAGGFDGQCREQWRRQPPVEEGAEDLVVACMTAACFQGRSQGGITRAALCPLLGIRDSRTCPENDEGAHSARIVERETETVAAPHRVPDVHGLSTGRPDQGSAGREARSGRWRGPVTGRIHSDDLVVCCEPSRDGSPRAMRLGETMDENDARAGACRRPGAVSLHAEEAR